MNQHPQIEVYPIPTIRIRNSIGKVTKGKYISARHALDRYLICWRWYTYRKTGIYPTSEELDAERGRMLDSLEDALSDMSRQDMVVVI